MKQEFESNQDSNMAVKSLIALSFLFEGGILESFFELADNFPPLYRVEELITYFKVTNIQGKNRGQGRRREPPRFPPEM